MKHIRYQDQVHPIPENIFDMTVGQFAAAYAFDRDYPLSEIEKLDDLEKMKLDFQRVSILSGIPLETVHLMPWITFYDLRKHVDQIDHSWPVVQEDTVWSGSTKVRKEKVSFTHEDRTFFLQLDYSHENVLTVAQFEDTLRGKDIIEHLAFVLAIIAREEGEVFDFNTMQEKAEFMSTVPMKDVFSFFLSGAGTAPKFSLLDLLYSGADQRSRRMIQGTMAVVLSNIAAAETR